VEKRVENVGCGVENRDRVENRWKTVTASILTQRLRLLRSWRVVPRHARVVAVGAPHHVAQRGNTARKPSSTTAIAASNWPCWPTKAAATAWEPWATDFVISVYGEGYKFAGRPKTA